MTSDVHGGFLFSDNIRCCNSYNSGCKNSMNFREKNIVNKLPKNKLKN